jgi:hypothetical protein
MSSKGNTFVLKVKEFYTVNNRVTGSTGASIKIGSITYTARQFKKLFTDQEMQIASFVGKQLFFSKVGEMEIKFKANNEDTLGRLSEIVYQLIVSEVNKQNKDKTAGSIDLSANGYNYRNKMPIIDRRTTSRLIFDNEKKCIDFQSDYDAWKEYRSYQSKEVKDIMSMGVTVADINYDPYSPTKVELREVNGQADVLTINAHITPKWRDSDKISDKLPPMFVEFMNHLFCNDKDSIEYVLNWMHFMLVDRNHCMLLLHGGRGIGKGSFHTIIRRLVGLENFVLMPSGFFDSRFNGELKYKRVVCFDDYPVKREFINEWKQLPEPYMSVEEKNAKVVTYLNHASFLITNNTEAEVALLGDERKFSVPKCPTDGKVNDVLGHDRFEEFMRAIEDDDELIASIGTWLIKHGESKRFDNRRPFISDTFHEIVEKALTNWQRGIINEIERCEADEINLAHIEDITRGTGRTKIEKFLNVHRDRNGELYGSLKQIKGGDRVIVPSKAYLPDTSNTEEVNTDINLENMEF